MKYQNKNLEYTDAVAYDKRGENSVLERYVLSLWQPFLKEKIKNLSAGHANGRAGKIVVDLGCGTCEYTQEAKAAKEIYAVDISEPMLQVCRKKLSSFLQVEIIKTAVKDFKLPADSADLVITIGVWEYINPIVLFNKIKEITHQGSKVIVVFPNIYNDLNWMRSLAKMKSVALRLGFIKKLFKDDFLLIDSASFGTVFWFPKKLQFLVEPIWKLEDWFWRPFQKFFPLGVNVYYLFERR